MRTPLHRAHVVVRVLGVAAIAALPLAACGDDDEGGADDGASASGTEAPAGDAIVVTATDSLSFDPASLDAPAGEISFELVNDGSLQHTFVFEGLEDDLKLEVASSGDTDEGSTSLEEGDYVFYCDVAGHRAGGMEGTLTVGPAE